MKVYSIIFCIGILGFFASCQKQNCEAIPNNACPCPKNYDPVCGCDRQTYDNTCIAECNNIVNYTSGKCN